MKAIAFYLPQFHRIPENDKWWGEGYTEWNAVKSAVKLFPDHYQPHIPLHHNYYNLLDKKTMLWQAELMKKYHVYGMCFYHYYFQDGRKILEKPAENLLEWKDIDMPFCFSWANETWGRTWSRIGRVNTWNDRMEQKSSKDDDGILIKQNYGDENDWERHFEYLFPFFMDSRYIRIDNKPVFIIYRPDDIFCLPQMMEKWNEKAKQGGLDGIYFIATNSEKYTVDARLRQNKGNWVGGKNQYEEYDEVCESIIKQALQPGDSCYLCGYIGYDDSPRRGEQGVVVTNSSPEKFYTLMRTLCYLSEQREKEYIFVNAWNEWGEGMHLEPDEKYGYGHLEALSKALQDYRDIKEIDMKTWAYCEKRTDVSLINRKNLSIMNIFDRWLRIKEDGKALVSYFQTKHYENIAIYGIGMVGKHLLVELKGSSVNVIYGIDKRGKKWQYPFPIYDLDTELPEADVIVVTVAYEFEAIYRELRRKSAGKIISLEEILEWIDCH